MASDAIRGEERIGLGLAIAAHIGLVALLVWRPPSPPLIPPPERMTVTLSDNVGLTSTSPEPMADAAPDMAPTIGEAQPEPVAEPAPVPQPREVPPPLPRPAPVAKAQPAPPKPVAKPAAKAEPAPPKPKQTSAAREQRQAAATQRQNSNAPAGASRFSDAFKTGVPGATQTGTSRNAPAAGAGPSQASLAGAIARELKPNWAAPQGADAEKLVTILAWSLNRDGTLAGTPRVVRQDGITDANRAQAARHAEQAIRAVQLAAPFDLPDEFYNSWKRVSSFRFDKRLSQ
jgi:outer membrane biosynthesis protein TonB